MNILVALLAFAAVMIVFATLVTVIVETFHKLFQRRRQGFREMMEHFYRGALEARLPATGGASAPPPQGDGPQTGEARFAREIIANPAYVAGGRWGWLRWVWGLRGLFNSNFESLTTRQFVEQLARTEAGKALGELAEAELKQKLTQLSYEFERYGEAASDYFARRATAISVLAAIGLALTVNVDAIRLFSSLARDRALAEKVVAESNVEDLKKAWTAAQAGEDRPADETPPEMAAAAMKRIQAEASRLTGLGLPIGHDFFPYCRTPLLDDRCRPAMATDAAERGAAGLVTSAAGTERRAIADAEKSCAAKPAPTGGGAVAGLMEWISRVGARACVWSAYAEPVLARIFTADGLGWLFSALLAGGLIGLGAPFWFDVYRKVASVTPIAGRIQAALAPGQPKGQPGAAARPEPIRKPESEGLTPDDLLKAFETAGGRGLSGAAPPQRRRQI